MRKDFEDSLTWLDAMAGWPDGWNGYNARAPQSEYIQKAKEWLSAFHEVVGSFWQNPSITGTGNGGVCLEWWNKSKKLEIEIDEEGIDYFKVWGSRYPHEIVYGEVILPDFLEVWQWFLEEEK